MKHFVIFIIGMVILASTGAVSQESVVFYNGGMVGETYLWTWGFGLEPAPALGTGYNPGTSAIEVLWEKAIEGWDESWISYGAYIGDIPFDVGNIFPDSMYFKLRAPEGWDEADRLNLWIYDPRNSTWDNALLYELEEVTVLADSAWHAFSVGLFDFWEFKDPIDYANVIAVSFERPAEDEDPLYPLMLIDQVWVGDPMLPVQLSIFDGTGVTSGIDFGAWGFQDNSLKISDGEGSAEGRNALRWESSDGYGWQGQQFSFPPQDMSHSWDTDFLNIKIKAPVDVNPISLGLYDADGNAMWIPVDAATFGFNGDWVAISLPLSAFSLYWDSFDNTRVTEFRIENGYENQTIDQVVLFDDIWTGASAGGLSAVKSEGPAAVSTYTLSDNYPNPFNPSTTIEYSLPQAGEVSLLVFNVLGEHVYTLESGYQTQGVHSVAFDASTLASGVYYYQLKAGEFSQIKKMLLIK